MSTTWLPCGTYHENYREDHAWFQTGLIRTKMLLLVGLALAMPLILSVMPRFITDWFNIPILIRVMYYVLGAFGVQLLIGYCGQITLGHAAFIAVGGYTSALFLLQLKPLVPFLHDVGLLYPISIVAAGLVAGLWSVLFGLPSAKVKGFYLIMTTIAAQFVTVNFIITQYVAQIGGRGQAFSVTSDLIKIGPFTKQGDLMPYYLGVGLVIICGVMLANLLRSRVGRAWVAIRDNDIAAEALGINIVRYKLAAFFVAGFIGGVAGAFWVGSQAAISPEHFEWLLSLELVGVILIGGVGSIHGTFFGALFLILVMEIIKSSIHGLEAVWPYMATVRGSIAFIKEMVYGLAICAFLIYEPNGLAYRWWQVKNYFNLWPFSYRAGG